jgi:hypothetical protein
LLAGVDSYLHILDYAVRVSFVQAIPAQPAKNHTQNAIFRCQAALAERIYTPIILKNIEGVFMETKQGLAKYFWQVTYAHTIAYFIAGIFAAFVLNYRDLFATDIISSFMHPVDAPIVALGPVLQIFRGILIALILLPLRKAFFDEEYGFLKLGLMVIGLSLLTTFGPTSGSFEGYIYTKIPYKYQMLGYPEAILYVLLFIGILAVSKRYAHKKIIIILSIVIMVLIGYMSIMGFLSAKGLL